MQGHRKIASAAATFATGEVIGKDVLIWAWSLLDRSLDGLLGALPETVAIEIVMLVSMAAFYVTREEEVVRREPAVPREQAEPSTRGVACRPLAVLAALAMGLLLAGCEWPRFVPEDVGIGHAALGASAAATEPAEQSDQSLLDEIADRIVAANTPKERGPRVCMFAAVASELTVYRIIYGQSSPADVDMAVGAMTRMKARLAELKASGDTLWFNTEMFYAVVDLLRGVEGPARSRVLGIVAGAATLNWRGIAREARTTAGQVGLSSAMFRDVRNAFAESRAPADIWAACEQRIDQNLARVS